MSDLLQTEAFPETPRATFTRLPLTVAVVVQLVRHRRQRCANCDRRRICFSLAAADVVDGPAYCAVCSGIR